MATRPDATDTLQVEVVYARPERQVLLALSVPRGTTLGEAIARSGIAQQFPELAANLTEAKVGIFGQLSHRDAVLQNGDRVEIYRPLLIDPKERRRQRAARRKR